MTRAVRPLRILTSLALLAFSAGAQAQQALLEGYPRMVSALDRALESQAQNPAASLDRLDEAGNQYRRLAPDITSRILAGGVSSALDKARSAVSRGQTDLTAQVGLVRGLMRRALQDAVLDTTEAKSTLAPRLSALLSSDVGLPANEAQQLAAFVRAGDAEDSRKLLQRHATRKMQAALEGASNTNQNAAFAGMALASAWFMSVQGAPEAADVAPNSFSTALTELVAGNRPAFDSQRTALRSSAATLVGALAPGSAPTSSAATPSNPPTVPTTPPAPSAGAGNPAPSPAATPAPAASSLSAADKVYPPLARALAAASSADVPGARSLLQEAQQAFDGGLGQQLSSKDPAAKARIDDRFRALQDGMSSVGLRPSDVQTLMGDIVSADDALLENAPAAQSASSAVGGVWMGWLRALTFILIGVLAFFPLRYLNLAFGGRNRYWRYIGVAMVLLFVPALLEGLAYLGSVLSELTGVRFFDALSNLSVFQNPVMQLLWAAVLLVATGFAIAGFRGICIQFGLIRVRGQNLTTTQLDTAATTTGGDRAKTGKNTFEWDEEF